MEFVEGLIDVIKEIFVGEFMDKGRIEVYGKY